MDENEKRLLRQIDAFVKRSHEGILRDMKTLVDIKSVQGEPAPGAPFGTGPKRALEAALEIASGMGLFTRNCEGYVGYADLPGKSEKQIALITHLDVVPEGSGWTGDPFCMTLRDGFAVGRGTADDKGPAVITLYAAKFFKEQGVKLPYTLRVLFGTNEETGMQDVDYYLAHYPQPAFCFSPDARFPVGYAEKGGYSGWLVSAPLNGCLREFFGGEAKNVVPDRAYALVRTEKTRLPDTENITIRAENGCVRIEARGKGGHVAGPQGSVNAIGLVVGYLLDNGLCTPQEERALRMLRTLHADTDGSALGVDLCPRHGGDNIPFRRFKPAECEDDVRFKQITGAQAAHLLHQRRRQGRFAQMRVVCVRQNTALRIRKEHFVMVGAACGKYLMKLRNAHIGKKHTAQLVVIRLAFQRHSTGNNGGGLGYA